jgi:hypothetical protein
MVEGDFWMKRLILIFLIPLLVLACGEADDTGGELVSYTSPNYPISFTMPAAWAVSDNEDSITIASAESLLLANTVVDGARINMTVTLGAFMGNANVTEVIETAVRPISGPGRGGGAARGRNQIDQQPVGRRNCAARPGHGGQ